jgi:hypothetical protein
LRAWKNIASHPTTPTQTSMGRRKHCHKPVAVSPKFTTRYKATPAGAHRPGGACVTSRSPPLRSKTPNDRVKHAPRIGEYQHHNASAGRRARISGPL